MGISITHRYERGISTLLKPERDVVGRGCGTMAFTTEPTADECCCSVIGHQLYNYPKLLKLTFKYNRMQPNIYCSF